MVSYGVVALNHDASLTVMVDEEVVFFKKASEYSGVPNDFFLNADLIADAFAVAKPDKIGFFENPYVKKYRQLLSGQIKIALDTELLPKTYLHRVGFSGYPIEHHTHHKSHVAYAKHSLKFKESLVLVADAVGEMDTVSIWHVKGNTFKKLYSIKYPASLGLFYSAFTKLAGMVPVRDEGKFMSLSCSGNPKTYKHLVKPYLYKNVHLGVKGFPAGNLATVDLAAAVQEVFQDELLRLVKKCRGIAPELPIVFTGGCAYNKLAVEYIQKQVSDFCVVNNPGDAFSSVGAAYLTYLKARADEKY